jgi:N6-adenosine-specific RNA methylase IME4
LTEPFRVILSDPPWKFGDSLPGPKRGASSHYGCLSVSEIARFPLPPIAKDATLVLWRVASMIEEAAFIVRAWGFVPKAELVWVKTQVGSDGRHKKLRIGMGRQVRNAHEVAIIATRGKGAARLSKSEPSVVFAPRAQHSRKPDASYELLERLYEGPRVELFATREREGWSCYGNALGEERARPEAAE